MRELVMTRRMNVIMIPATSGFNFPCSNLPYEAQINDAIKGHNQDWDRYRYRRK